MPQICEFSWTLFLWFCFFYFVIFNILFTFFVANHYFFNLNQLSNYNFVNLL